VLAILLFLRSSVFRLVSRVIGNRIGNDENASTAGSNAEHSGGGILLRNYTVGLPRSIPRAVQNVIGRILTSIVTTSIAVIVKVGRVGFSRKFPFIRFWLVVPE
jgi:hypothetical protein